MMFGFTFIIFIIYLAHLQFTLDLQSNKFPPTLFYLIASLFSILVATYAKNFTSHVNNLIIAGNKLIRFLNYSGKNVFPIYLSQGFGASLIIPLSVYFVQTDIHWMGILAICLAVNIAITYSFTLIFIPIHRTTYGHFSLLVDRIFQRLKGAINATEAVKARGELK